MKKLNQLAMLVATVALATTAVAQDINNWRNAGGDVWKSSYSDQNLQLPISLKFNHFSTTGYEMFGLIPVGATQTPANYNDGAYKFYSTATSTYGYFTTTWDFGAIAILKYALVELFCFGETKGTRSQRPLNKGL